jgi:hypothetical protein
VVQRTVGMSAARHTAAMRCCARSNGYGQGKNAGPAVRPDVKADAAREGARGLRAGREDLQAEAFVRLGASGQ